MNQGIPLKDLSKGDALTSKLKVVLDEENSVAVLFYDHGSRRRFVAQNLGALIDYVSAKLLKGRLVYSMCCLSGADLGRRILNVGALAFFGYDEPFGFFIGPSEPAFRMSANEGWNRLALGDSVRKARESMVQTFNNWFDFYTEGPGVDDPNAPLISSWLIHDRDCLVVLGDMDLTLEEIPTPPEPEPPTTWERFIGFIWSILDAFGL